MYSPLEQFEINFRFRNRILFETWDVTAAIIDRFCSENVIWHFGFEYGYWMRIYVALKWIDIFDIRTSSFVKMLVYYDKFIYFCTSNFIVFLYLLIFCLFFFFYQLLIQYRIIPKIWFFSLMFYFQLVQQIINDLLLNFKGKLYFFFLLFCLFIFINICNIMGLIPYTFAITSYFSITFFFAFIFFFTFFFIGIYYHGIEIVNLFLPAGTPLVIVPLLVLIEIISYFARVFSLSIRLFANITAGHILLKILSWFIFLLFNFFFLSISGFLLICLLWCLEFFISILQAYVFLILLCIYLNEVLFLEH